MTPSKLARKSERPEVDSMDESNAKPAENPSTPLTLAEAARQMNWGAGDQAMKPDPNTDRYFITTTGTTDPNWTPGPEDWERLAEMFRGR
jgi:hypothetical protein